MIFTYKKTDKSADSRYWRDHKYRNRATRLYVWIKDETIWENLQNRRVRPYTVWRKEIVPTVLQALELPADTKVRWSRKAGCSCGCSPGFILPDYHTFDVSVTVYGEKQ